MLTLLTLISRLPFRVLYCISDVIYVFVYLIFGYRRKIVRRNLSESFPEMSEKELRETERKFYHWLCDYFMETVKLLTVSDEELYRRVEQRGLDEVYAQFKEGQSCSLFLGHQGNWEMLSASKVFWPESMKDFVAGLIYHPLRNKGMDDIMLKARSQHHGTCIPKNNILREAVKYRKQGIRYVFGYIFDQTPKWENIHLWLDFLHHNTPVFTGAERITRRMNDAAVFADFERPERGKYIVNYTLITNDPASLPENELTKRCFEILENAIMRDPYLYLWTHNRWKRTYEEWIERQQESK